MLREGRCDAATPRVHRFAPVVTGRSSSVLLYFAIGLLGALLLVLAAVLGEVTDFFGDHDLGGDGNGATGKVIAVGMTAFGATGMIATYYDWGALMSGITAALAALFMGAAAWWVIGRLYAGTASTNVEIGAMRGRRAQVTVNIPADSVGEVLVTSADSTRHMIARSRDGSPIPAGVTVRIVETMGSMVLVERLDTPAPVADSAQPA
jgi:membrane-bound ClpP family serine protease